MTLDTTPTWKLAHDRQMHLDRPRILAIVNVTPDSFSDGGRYSDPETAAEFAYQCLDNGADMIDVGGESTRPGATPVSADEQMRRILPVIERILSNRPDALVSVDTTRSAVAQAAIEAGVHAINDVSAGTDDERIFEVAGRLRAGLILMHRLRPPTQDVFSHEYSDHDRPQYDIDVVEAVDGWLKSRARVAEGQGVARNSIVLDPGLGFGKTVHQNFELIRSFDRLAKIGHPLLSAASRKSFIGNVTGVTEPQNRVVGTLAVSLLHFTMGVRLFRVHDVKEHRQAFDCVSACLGQSEE